MNMERFVDKVVIITGASSGIGEATAIAFAKEGAKVCIVGRNIERLKKTKNACESCGSKEVLTLQVNLGNNDELSTIITKTIDTFGKIDILVNNAGLIKDQAFKNVTLEDYDAQMNLNFRAPFFLCQSALPYLEKTKGNIVNISSVASLIGKHPANATIVYSASKAALDHFSRCLSSICAASGVRVNNINPAYVDTAIWDLSFPDKNIRELAKASVSNFQPLGMIPAQNIATTVLFVASTDAQYMTGVTLPVDAGGMNFTTTAPKK